MGGGGGGGGGGGRGVSNDIHLLMPEREGVGKCTQCANKCARGSTCDPRPYLNQTMLWTEEQKTRKKKRRRRRRRRRKTGLIIDEMFLPSFRRPVAVLPRPGDSFRKADLPQIERGRPRGGTHSRARKQGKLKSTNRRSTWKKIGKEGGIPLQQVGERPRSRWGRDLQRTWYVDWW